MPATARIADTAPGTPAITVAMSVMNGARFLHDAMASVLAQTTRDFELVVVDDGSTDATPAILAAHAAADARVRVLTQPNRGLVASLNRILAEARAPLFARMDGDDVALPERLAVQAAWLADHPVVVALGTGFVPIDESGHRGHPVRNVVTPAEVLADLPNGPPLCHPSVVMRTDALRAVGGYRAAYRHCEDYDLWLRLSERGALANLPEPLLLYRHNPNQVSQRHVLEQKYGAAVAWEAHVERMAKRPDPTAALERLPPLAALDALFKRPGAAAAVRAKLAAGVLYSPDALVNGGLDHVIDELRAGGAHDGLWRTVARLARHRQPRAATRLARALLRA